MDKTHLFFSLDSCLNTILLSCKSLDKPAPFPHKYAFLHYTIKHVCLEILALTLTPFLHEVH